MCCASTPCSISVSRASVTSSAGPHRNHSSTSAGASAPAQPALELVAVDPSTQVRGVARVTAQDVDDLQAVGVARLELVELVAEHRRWPGAVAVDQREAALGLDLERRLEHRQDRRDAAADGDRDVVLAVERVQRRAEAPGRGHHLEHVAGLELLGDEGGERAAGDVLDRDPQRRAGGGRADRVVAPHALAPRSVRTVTCWPGSKRNSSRSSSGTAKVTSVLSSVIGSTEATGSR